MTNHVLMKNLTQEWDENAGPKRVIWGRSKKTKTMFFLLFLQILTRDLFIPSACWQYEIDSGFCPFFFPFWHTIFSQILDVTWQNISLPWTTLSITAVRGLHEDLWLTIITGLSLSAHYHNGNIMAYSKCKLPWARSLY